MSSMMVREMHHRIKNNLQMIAMLLRMEMSDPKNAAASGVLHQMVNRISNIAAVHEALSQDGFRVIGVHDLIQKAAHLARSTMVPPGKEIEIHVEGAPMRMPSQPATTIALAVNELIQNALEHGFEDSTGGTVHVILTERGKWNEIRVEDDGSGLPSGFDKEQSLGLRIVQGMIVEDLRGEFKIANRRGKHGTVATLRIPQMKAT